MNPGIEPGRAGDILREAFISALADMAFIDAGPCPRPPRGAGIELAAAIDALKPTSFRVELRFGASFRERVAGILFPDGSNAAARDDAILELLNVATGKFITDYFGPEAEIKLELPRFDYQGELGEGVELAAFALDAEGDALLVTLRSVRYRY